MYLQKLIYNFCWSSFTYSYIVIYITVKSILIFADIGIHPNIDLKFSDVRGTKFLHAVFIIDITALNGFNRLPGIIYVIINYIIFIIYVRYFSRICFFSGLPSAWFSNNLIFLLCFVRFPFSILHNISL